MKTYYITSIEYPRGIEYIVEKGNAWVGEGTTSTIDLVNTGHIKVAEVTTPTVYEHRYNEENKELKFVWKAKVGKYNLWTHAQSIYFQEK